MKTVTNAFKTQIKTAGRMVKNKITYEINNQEYIITDDDLYNIKYTTPGNLLKTVMRILEIDVRNNIPINSILTCQFGLKVNDEYEWVNMGSFIVYESEKREETGNYHYICYDKMLYTMVDYESLNLTYPLTIRQFTNAIATHFGLTFKNNNETFVNYDKEISNELFLSTTGQSLGFTFRDVLDQIAEATASNIFINEDDELEIKYITNTSQTFNGDSLKDVNVSFFEKYGPINSIVLSRAGESDNVYLRDETSVEENGLCEIKIIENQIMNGNDRSDYLQEILNQLDGTEYYLNNFTSTGIVYLEICDKFNINVNENNYSCILFNDELNLGKGIEEKIYTELPNTSETDYKKADKTDRRINQAYIIVDKQNQQIESLTSTVNQVEAETNNIYQDIVSKFTAIDEALTQIDSIENRVTQLQTDTYTKTEVQQIANGVGVDGVVVSVVTSTAGTFDENGLTIEKTNAKTKGNFNETGITVMDATGYSDEELLFAGYDNDLGETIVRTKNINVSKYLTIGQNSRLEDYEDGTGIFFIGS